MRSSSVPAPISAGVGAQCAVIAAASQALNIVEIGTGAGVSGLWLLHGSPRATLTTIDNEPEHLGAARQAFAEAKIPPARARFITGRAAEVLPRMNEASYDIVLVDADPEGVIEYVEHGLRLVRAGGTVLVPRVLGGGAVADPVRRDAVTDRLPLAHPGDPGLARGDRRAVDRRRGSAAAHDRSPPTDAAAAARRNAKNGRSEDRPFCVMRCAQAGLTTPPSTS